MLDYAEDLREYERPYLDGRPSAASPAPLRSNTGPFGSGARRAPRPGTSTPPGHTTVDKLKAADLGPRGLLGGMKLWTSDLARRLELLEAVGWSWLGSNYHELRDMIKATPSAAKASVRGPRWRAAFVNLCNNKSILDAVQDLEISEPERTDWINAEN